VGRCGSGVDLCCEAVQRVAVAVVQATATASFVTGEAGAGEQRAERNAVNNSAELRTNAQNVLTMIRDSRPNIYIYIY